MFQPLARPQTDLYSFPEVDEAKPKKEEPKPVEPFVQALAKKMDLPEKVLTEATEKGFGRMELIRLILMAKKSGKSLTDLIQEREKGTRLAKIAESAKADNRAVKKEAGEILKDLEKDAEKIKYEMSKSTAAAVAGVEPSKTEKHERNRRHRTPE